jgi:tRNA(fMet)-specific endonuclease VapC
LRAELVAAGTAIGVCHVLLAGQATARGVTLVTVNVREFERVNGRRCEDWGKGGR